MEMRMHYDDNPKFSVELDAEFKMASITNIYVWNKDGVSTSVGTNYTLVVFEEVYTQSSNNSSGCSKLEL
jgi:hypothetical protein